MAVEMVGVGYGGREEEREDGRGHKKTQSASDISFPLYHLLQSNTDFC